MCDWKKPAILITNLLNSGDYCILHYPLPDDLFSALPFSRTGWPAILLDYWLLDGVTDIILVAILIGGRWTEYLTWHSNYLTILCNPQLGVLLFWYSWQTMIVDITDGDSDCCWCGGMTPFPIIIILIVRGRTWTGDPMCVWTQYYYSNDC